MGTWKCSYCDSYNPDTVDQCITCGRDRRDPTEGVDGRPKELTKTCPECGGTNPLGRRRCQWCGAELPVSPDELALEWAETSVATGDAAGEDLEAEAALLEEAAPTLQDVPVVDRKPKMRPCQRCGTMLSPDEWVVVAGPRLLCRICYYEEFGKKRGKKASGEAPEEGAGSGDAAGDATGGTAEPAASSEPPRSRLPMAYGVSAGVFLVLGGVVTALAGLVWGLTPLGAGVVFGVLAGVEASKSRRRVDRDAARPR